MTAIEAPLAALPGIDHGIELVPLFRGTWKVNPYLMVPNGPIGTRAIVEMPSGRLEGRGITARAAGGANADWMVIDPNGIGTADWRGAVETDDGAIIYLHGNGRVDLNSGFGGGAMLIGSAQFETGDARYCWLNKVHAVFRGLVAGDGMAGTGVYHDEYFEVR